MCMTPSPHLSWWATAWYAVSPTMETAIQPEFLTMASLAPILASRVPREIKPFIASRAACIKACISRGFLSTTPALRAAPTRARVIFWGRSLAIPPTSVATAFQPSALRHVFSFSSDCLSVVQDRRRAARPTWLSSVKRSVTWSSKPGLCVSADLSTSPEACTAWCSRGASSLDPNISLSFILFPPSVTLTLDRKRDHYIPWRRFPPSAVENSTI